MLWSSFLATALNVAVAGGLTLPVASPIPAESPNPTTPPPVGEPAPDFDYQSYDYHWVRFHHMLARAAVVLVFEPDDSTLSALETQRELLAARNVAPVAVLARREDAVRRAVADLGLGFSLLSDPRGVIARDFGAWDSVSERAAPAWCVVGSDGRIRAQGRGALRVSVLVAATLEAPRTTTAPPASPAAAN